ncbi:MAG: SDR family NAD(P)-dependent oxidoreductase, partial [Bacteroidales bacterium]|nr:SDR family NAD(P)-dependent oxidoreductase [Bacteroidales bacterium]
MILVTGGTGYIGSHTVVALLDKGYEVVIIDNLSNSEESVLNGIKKITGKTPAFVKGDVKNQQTLDKLFQD